MGVVFPSLAALAVRLAWLRDSEDPWPGEMGAERGVRKHYPVAYCPALEEMATRFSSVSPALGSSLSPVPGLVLSSNTTALAMYH